MRAKKFLDILFIISIVTFARRTRRINPYKQQFVTTHTHKKIILIELAFQNAFYEYEALNCIVCATYKNNEDKSVQVLCRILLNVLINSPDIYIVFHTNDKHSGYFQLFLFQIWMSKRHFLKNIWVLGYFSSFNYQKESCFICIKIC